MESRKALVALQSASARPLLLGPAHTGRGTEQAGASEGAGLPGAAQYPLQDDQSRGEVAATEPGPPDGRASH
jgi:hypothetical protein